MIFGDAALYLRHIHLANKNICRLSTQPSPPTEPPSPVPDPATVENSPFLMHRGSIPDKKRSNILMTGIIQGMAKPLFTFTTSLAEHKPP